MKLYEVIDKINESRREDLYHGTSIDNAMEILSTDMFYASQSSTSEAQVSFTRQIGQAIRFSQYIEPAGVVFVIDGELLKRQVGKKMKSFDANLSGMGGAEEKEEAVWKDINNASAMIKQIIVFTNVDGSEEELDPEEYSDILNDPRTIIKQHDNYRSTDNMTRKQFDRT